MLKVTILLLACVPLALLTIMSLTSGAANNGTAKSPEVSKDDYETAIKLADDSLSKTAADQKVIDQLAQANLISAKSLPALDLNGATARFQGLAAHWQKAGHATEAYRKFKGIYTPALTEKDELDRLKGIKMPELVLGLDSENALVEHVANRIEELDQRMNAGTLLALAKTRYGEGRFKDCLAELGKINEALVPTAQQSTVRELKTKAQFRDYWLDYREDLRDEDDSGEVLQAKLEKLTEKLKDSPEPLETDAEALKKVADYQSRVKDLEVKIEIAKVQSSPTTDLGQMLAKYDAILLKEPSAAPELRRSFRNWIEGRLPEKKAPATITFTIDKKKTMLPLSGLMVGQLTGGAYDRGYFVARTADDFNFFAGVTSAKGSIQTRGRSSYEIKKYPVKKGEYEDAAVGLVLDEQGLAEYKQLRQTLLDLIHPGGATPVLEDSTGAKDKWSALIELGNRLDTEQEKRDPEVFAEFNFKDSREFAEQIIAQWNSIQSLLDAKVNEK